MLPLFQKTWVKGGRTKTFLFGTILLILVIEDFPPPRPVFSGWEEASVTSNQTKILDIDLEELLREDSDNYILSDPSLRTQSNVHDSSKENDTENSVDDSDKKVEPTTIVKGSDGKYKIKPQEVLRED